MSKQNMIPCASGKCGVQSHIIGSAEQKACSATAASFAPGFNPVAPAILSQTNKMIALPVFREDMQKQKDAVERRDQMIAGTPTGNNLSDWAFRLRNNEAKRRELANQEYADGNWEDKVKQSFKNILTGARDARPSIEGGESVKPFKSGHRGYSDIKYVKDQYSIQITATEQDGSESVIDYRSDEIAFRNEFYGRSVPMRSSGYLNANSVVHNPRRQPYDRERAQEYLELLVHCQNEKNWN